MSEEKDNVIELEGSLTEVREGLKKKDLDKRFIIFALDYGVGKTSLIEDKILSGELPEGNFFAQRQGRIDETTQKFDEKGFSDYQHIYGFGYVKDGEPKGCPEFTTNKDIEKYYDKKKGYGLSPKIVCQIVCKGKSKCPYRDQFNNDKAWQFAPHDFLNIFKPKTINVIDESVTAIDEFKYPGELNFEVLKKYTNANHNENKNFEDAIDYAITKAAGEEEKEDLIELLKIRTKYQTFWESTKSKIKPSDGYFYIPRIFKVFEYLRRGANVILLDGGFNLDLFNHFRERYSIDIPDPIIYTSNLKNKETKVIRVNPRKKYYYGPKDNRRWDWDLTFTYDPLQLIEALKRQGEKIGIITPKDIEATFEMEGVITSHFGDTSGSNKFVGCDALILVGEDHWGNESLGELYLKIFGLPASKERVSRVREERMKLVYQVMYTRSIEAGFRIRPLGYNVDIYFFRKVPNTFINKFNYEEKKIENILEELEPEGVFKWDFPKLTKIIAKSSNAKNKTELSKMIGLRGRDYQILEKLFDRGWIKKK